MWPLIPYTKPTIPTVPESFPKETIDFSSHPNPDAKYPTSTPWTLTQKPKTNIIKINPYSKG